MDKQLYNDLVQSVKDFRADEGSTKALSKAIKNGTITKSWDFTDKQLASFPEILTTLKKLTGDGDYFRNKKSPLKNKKTMPRPKGKKTIVMVGKGAYKRKAPKAKIAYIKGPGSYQSRVKTLRGKGAYDKQDTYARRLGADLGEGAGMLFSKLFGEGAYKVQHNSLMDQMTAGGPPIMHTGSAGFRVRHREYLQDIYTASTNVFNLNNFPINPGLFQTFPWLSLIAAGFEQYKIHGMILEFNSTSADALNSTNTALGELLMATEYDSTRPNFANKQQMLNHEFACSSRQSASSLHPIECKKVLTPTSELWVRTGTVPSGDDERLYDWGNFQIATIGQQGATVNIGELWISYDIEFFKPQLLGGLGLQLLSDKYKNSTGISTSAYFGTGSGLTAVTGSNLGTVLGTSTITFPSYVSEGTFQLMYWCIGTSSASVFPTVTATTNCSLLSVWDVDGSSALSSGSITSTNMQYLAWFKITGQSAVITFSAGTFVTSPTSLDMTISQVNGNIIT